MKQKILLIAVAAGSVVGLLAASAPSAFATVPTFTQSSVTVGLGQSVTVTAQNTGVYMLSNSTPTAATVSVNGSQVTVTGVGLGSTQVALCGVGTASDCTNLYVTVQAGAVTSISFSQNNLSLTVGANQTITVSGGNGTYTLSSNSNTAAATATLSGSLLTVNAVAAGSASINVCDTSSNCAALSVTVNAAGSTTGGAGAVIFGATNPTVAAGQTVNISLTNGSNYYISSNTNSSIATGLISGGTTLAVTGVSVGSDSFTVCSGNGSGCSTISVTVSGAGSTTSGSTSGNAYVNFSNASATVVAGQTVNITLSPGYQAGGSVTGYVVLTNQNSSIASANINSGTVLAIGGLRAGTDLIAVCAQGNGCNSIAVTVTGSAPVPATTTTAPTTTAPAPATPAPVVTTAPTTVANSSLISAIQSLQSVMAQLVGQIQSLQTQLSQIVVQASSGSASAGSGTGTGTAGSYYFTEQLAVGSQDAEVTALQQKLIKLGFLGGAATGYYGAQTEAAVKAYQSAHGLPAVGYVGPSTRAALNAGN